MIIFLIVGQHSSYEGVVRPFYNLSKGMDEDKIAFALLNCGRTLVEYLSEHTRAQIIKADNKNDLFNNICDLKPNAIIGDDDLGRLKLVANNKKLNKIIYSQVLYGTHAICNNFDLSNLGLKQKILFNGSRFIPFFLLNRDYVRALQKCDMIIANSKSTATFLQTLYGIEIQSIVYPPVDTDVFKPTASKKSSKDVVLYLGSHAGDTSWDFLTQILKYLSFSGYTANVFGDMHILKKIKYAPSNVVFHERIDDDALADLYSKSVITICPQVWEQYGYAVVESMACGTPVLAFNYMGPSETIIHGKTGWLAENKHDFLKLLHNTLVKKQLELNSENIKDYVHNNFSIKSSVIKFERTLNLLDSN